MQDKELLWPLFSKIPTGKSVWGLDVPVDRNQSFADYRDALDGSLAVLDSVGRVIELFGITRQPTPHRISIGENTLFSCCALVAHTTPAIFGRAATIVSTDSISGGEIRIRISEGLELLEHIPVDAYGSLVDCRATDLLENPRSNFCCHVKHFNSAESAAKFCSQDSRCYYVQIEEFHAAAQQLFRRIWASHPERKESSVD